MLHRTRRDVQNGRSAVYQESLTLQLVGGTRWLIEQLLAEAHAASFPRTPGVSILTAQDGCWSVTSWQAKRPLGSLVDEGLIAMLDRCAGHPVYRALNEGRPEAMGEYLGLSEEYGEQRSRELGNHCLWCDEFFTKHAPELLLAGAVTERGDSDLLTLGHLKAGA